MGNNAKPLRVDVMNTFNAQSINETGLPISFMKAKLFEEWVWSLEVSFSFFTRLLPKQES